MNIKKMSMFRFVTDRVTDGGVSITEYVDAKTVIEAWSKISNKEGVLITGIQWQRHSSGKIWSQEIWRYIFDL
jgi:hypothetical protein